MLKVKNYFGVIPMSSVLKSPCHILAFRVICNKTLKLNHSYHLCP